MKISNVSQFAFSMARCLSSGMHPSKALELSAAASQVPALRRAALAAARACDGGETMADALQPTAAVWPRFVLPVIHAGEIGGRQVEAFKLIHEHCERLKPVLLLVRNTWLFPLICILAGWTARITLLLYFGRTQWAGDLVRDTFLGATSTILIAWGVLQIRPVREWFDALLLQLPVIRETLVRLNTVLFFATFKLAYEAGGLNVTSVLDMALATVGNSAIRKDFATIRPVLEDHGSFEDAFSQPTLLQDHAKSSIAAGAISGHLGASLDQIIRTEVVDLETTLDIFNRLFQRLVAYGVVMSVVSTILLCLAV